MLNLKKIIFFSSLLYNKKNSENKDSTIDSEFNEKIEEIFNKNINLKNRVPENEIKIDIFIGYNLPSKNLLEEIFYFLTNNIIEKYRQTENQFKNNYYEESEELKDGKQQYENAIEIINKYTYDNLSKNKIIMEVESKLEKGEKNKFYNLLFDDYLLFFIYRSFKEEKSIDIKNIKLFIYLILNNKFKFNTIINDMKNLSILLNWIESYSTEIIMTFYQSK